MRIVTMRPIEGQDTASHTLKSFVYPFGHYHSEIFLKYSIFLILHPNLLTVSYF